MGIKKVLKKVAKIGLPVGAAILAAKGLGNRSKKNWITKNNADVMNKRFAGKSHLDRFVEDKLTGDGKGMESVYKPKHFKKPEKKSWLPDWLPKWKWDGSGIGFRSKGGSVKSYSGGGAINTKLNGKVKFRTY